MSKDEGHIFFAYHVVCLVDVLGQKDKLAQWATLPDDGQVTQEFIQALRQTVGTVLAFRDQFVDLFNRFDQCTMPNKLTVLSVEQQQQYHRFKTGDVKVQRFSDTFLFSSQIPNTYGDVSIMPIYRVVTACGTAMLTSLATKTPVRGAICIGAGAELEDKSFYGPALAEAYRLESDVADYPRVVVSPAVCQFLVEGQTYSLDRDINQIMRQMANTCRSLLHRDEDGHWTVDFLGKGMRKLIGPNPRFVEAVERAADFVRSEATRFREVGNKKLAIRYELLWRYVESRLPLWGDSR